MVDKYGTGQDPDCYPGTSTLINLFDIRDDKTLEAAEHDITEICASELEFQPPPYNLEYLCQIHKTLFQDICPWAGQARQEEWTNANIAAVVCNYQLLEIIFERCIGDQLE